MGLRPVRLFCTKCDRYIPGDMEWSCSHCNYGNEGTRYYSFLNKCKNCKRAPKSVVCPHCGELNYLDKHRIGTHPASSLKIPIPPQTREEILRQRREERSDQKEDIEHKILIARLDKDLTDTEADMKPKDASAALEAAWQKHKVRLVGVDTIVHRELKNNAEQWKDNTSQREKFDTAVRNWAEDMSL